MVAKFRGSERNVRILVQEEASGGSGRRTQTKDLVGTDILTGIGKRKENGAETGTGVEREEGEVAEGGGVVGVYR